MTWARFERVCEHVCERDGPDAVMQETTAFYQSTEKILHEFSQELRSTRTLGVHTGEVSEGEDDV